MRRTRGVSPTRTRSCGFIAWVSLRTVGPTMVVVVHGLCREEGGGDLNFLQCSPPLPPMNTSRLFRIPKPKPHF